MVNFLRILALSGLIVLFLGGWLWYDYQKALRQPLEVGDAPVLYTVRSGMTFRAVAAEFKQHGWWQYPRYLLWHVHHRHLANKLKAGEYELRSGMSIDHLLDALAAGRTMQHAVTIVEGWTFARLREAIDKTPVLVSTLRGLDDATVMERLGHPGIPPEGRFFPDTYYVTAGTSDMVLLQRAYKRMEQTLETLWKERAADLPYKIPEEALTMASIVEKETAVPKERSLIASVFVQRLGRGIKLQTDPTVIYGLGRGYDGNLRRKDLENDTPYNTYVRAGLPPTPIAMPGKASLEAALNPAPAGVLYFVARGDGSHEFSRTLEEHNRAVARYQLGGAVPASP
ncbi:MAG: endolytic transglycosylase MltG [Chromatiales bacterium]